MDRFKALDRDFLTVAKFTIPVDKAVEEWDGTVRTSLNGKGEQVCQGGSAKM